MRWYQIFSIYSVIVLYKLGTGEILMTATEGVNKTGTRE